MYEQDLRIKKYVNAVERRLRMPRDIRARVMSDFSSSIAARREAGESVDDILASLGSPKKAAAELNEQMKEYTYTKSRWRLVFLAAAVAAGLYLLGRIVSMVLVWLITRSAVQVMGVIGGADGPTSVFVSTPIEPMTIQTKMVLVAVLLIVGIFGYYKFSRMKKK